ncbi:MAG: glutamyl-tRNA reductase [Bacteroidota bacterium]
MHYRKSALLQQLHIIAFTHRQLEVSKIGLLHIEKEAQALQLAQLKAALGLKELMFLTTCNRVEITFVHDADLDTPFLTRLLQTLYPKLVPIQLEDFVRKAEIYSASAAVQHALSVASSIDSMIIGEREIITQVRLAYEHCNNLHLTGDLLRLLIKKVIETAKQVYTETSISTKPVSVVSLAYQYLKQLNIPLEARVLIIGAGVTNTTMSRFLKKHGFKNFQVFNRSLANAQKLADEIRGNAYALDALATYQNGFDVLITCTAAEGVIITPALYAHLLNGETQEKIVIDLAIPQDLDQAITEHYPVKYLSIEYLQRISNENVKERSKELQQVEQIIANARYEFQHLLRERKVEIAMREVPAQVKELRATAYAEIFKEDLDTLDPQAKEVLDKVVSYLEKKYISGPMKLAKEIILNHAD